MLIVSSVELNAVVRECQKLRFHGPAQYLHIPSHRNAVQHVQYAHIPSKQWKQKDKEMESNCERCWDCFKDFNAGPWTGRNVICREHRETSADSSIHKTLQTLEDIIKSTLFWRCGFITFCRSVWCNKRIIACKALTWSHEYSFVGT